jgi:hypothetical protein
MNKESVKGERREGRSRKMAQKAREQVRKTLREKRRGHGRFYSWIPV